MLKAQQYTPLNTLRLHVDLQNNTVVVYLCFFHAVSGQDDATIALGSFHYIPQITPRSWVQPLHTLLPQCVSSACM